MKGPKARRQWVIPADLFSLGPRVEGEPIGPRNAGAPAFSRRVLAEQSRLFAAHLRQLVAQGIRDPSRTNRVNRELLS